MIRRVLSEEKAKDSAPKELAELIGALAAQLKPALSRVKENIELEIRKRREEEEREEKRTAEERKNSEAAQQEKLTEGEDQPHRAPKSIGKEKPTQGAASERGRAVGPQTDKEKLKDFPKKFEVFHLNLQLFQQAINDMKSGQSNVFFFPDFMLQLKLVLVFRPSF